MPSRSNLPSRSDSQSVSPALGQRCGFPSLTDLGVNTGQVDTQQLGALGDRGGKCDCHDGSALMWFVNRVLS